MSLTYPASPVPVELHDTPYTWPNVKTEFEAGYRQVRNTIGVALRGFKLVYDGLTNAQLATLYTFWTSAKGQALTFAFHHPVLNEDITCRFATNTWEPSRTSGVGDGWNQLTLVLEEAR